MENVRAIKAKQRQLDNETKAIADLEALYDNIMRYWSNIKFYCNIGHIQYATAILVNVEGSILYTLDWAAFLATEVKVRDEFEGNIIDLGVFQLIFFTSSNENYFIQDTSTICCDLVYRGPRRLVYPITIQQLLGGATHGVYIMV